MVITSVPGEIHGTLPDGCSGVTHLLLVRNMLNEEEPRASACQWRCCEAGGTTAGDVTSCCCKALMDRDVFWATLVVL